jgi:DNA-binding GntR family transcriptional regulator
VFRALGDVAALVYESIERGRLSPTTAAIVRSTGLSRTAVETALAAMGSYNMIERRHGQWTIVAGTSLTALARRLGALDDAAEQITRHRKERAAWHAWLDRNLKPELAEHEVADPDSDLYWIPPSETELDWVGTLWRAA